MNRFPSTLKIEGCVFYTRVVNKLLAHPTFLIGVATKSTTLMRFFLLVFVKIICFQLDTRWRMRVHPNNRSMFIQVNVDRLKDLHQQHRFRTLIQQLHLDVCQQKICFTIKKKDIVIMYNMFLNKYTVVKVDGATPKRWISKGPW